MGVSVIPIAVLTGFWAIVGIVVPFFVPKGPNRGVTQTVLILTAVCCYIFWLCCYMAQINPLIGPKLDNRTVLMMAREWGNAVLDG